MENGTRGVRGQSAPSPAQAGNSRDSGFADNLCLVGVNVLVMEHKLESVQYNLVKVNRSCYRK